MPALPTRFAGSTLAFAPLFVHRSWRHAQLLLIGAILTPGQRTVASVLRIMGRARERRFVNADRILNRAAWCPRSGSRILLGLLISAFVPHGPVVFGLDEMDVRAAFVADGQAAEAGEPRQRTLNDPAVAAQALTAFDAPARNAGHDPAGPAFPAATAVIVGLVGVQLAGPVGWASRAARAHGRDRVERGDQLRAVMPVGPG